MSNMLYEAQVAIKLKEFNLPLSKYTQSNCQITLTDEGYHWYRPPNLNQTDNGNTMYGGFCLRFNEPPFVKGNTYIIAFDVKGKDSVKPSFYWSNQAGWGGGGLNPSPSNVESKTFEAGYNSNEWMTSYYKWTINDDIYKTCTTAYSSFVAGKVYPSYRDFMFYHGYGSTGSLGTDLYINNLRMYDITNFKNIELTKTGILNTIELYENISFRDLQFHLSGEISANNFIEL